MECTSPCRIDSRRPSCQFVSSDFHPLLFVAANNHVLILAATFNVRTKLVFSKCYSIQTVMLSWEWSLCMLQSCLEKCRKLPWSTQTCLLHTWNSKRIPERWHFLKSRTTRQLQKIRLTSTLLKQSRKMMGVLIWTITKKWMRLWPNGKNNEAVKRTCFFIRYSWRIFNFYAVYGFKKSLQRTRNQGFFHILTLLEMLYRATRESSDIFATFSS